MSDCAVIVEVSPAPEDLRTVMKGLRDYNFSMAGDSNYEHLNIFLRDETDAVVGGLLGETYWGWLHIKELWVHEPLRGKGFGTKLMATAESEALKRRCRYAHLDTYSFQAWPFYERLGYSIFGVLEDYPTGHERIFLRKTLSP